MRYANRDRLLLLDPVADCHEVYRTLSTEEFPWDITRALELALYRTYAIPSIAALLDETGEFRLRTQKRYDDTVLLLSEVAEQGPDSPTGRAAVRRINQIHARFAISNDDMLYTLGTFVFVPLRWLDRWGWRPLTRVERQGSFHYYRRLGALMNIRDIPTELEDFERWFDAYEDAHLAYGAPQERTAVATRELVVGWFPGPVAPLVRLGVHGMLEPSLREAFAFPAPPRWLPPVLDRALRARAAAERRMRPRTQPVRASDSPYVKTAPQPMDQLGPS